MWLDAETVDYTVILTNEVVYLFRLFYALSYPGRFHTGLCRETPELRFCYLK